jgi:S-adenosylmethionine:tRNA ribosyltransferase-isomerase
VNRSRVFPARLLGRREGGGGAEVFLLRDLGDDRWEALVRPDGGCGPAPPSPSTPA